MRENLWLALRRSSVLRKLYAHRAFAGPMRIASQLLVPPSGRRRVRVRAGPAKGLLLELDPRWEHACWDGSYEPEAVATFMKFVKPDGVVFDIGSGLGFYALLAGRAGANVVTFEPDPENARSIIRHLEINHLEERIRVVQQAAFSCNGWLTLERSDGMSAHQNAKVRADLAETAADARVACTTLDDFIASNPQPSVVKIDVEGAESEVLKGADQLFRTHRPVLVCEVHDDANARFAQEWLRKRNYSCLWLEKGNDFPRHLLGSPVEYAEG